MGAVTKIMSMGTLIVLGFLKGFQPIAGFSYGAKDFDQLRMSCQPLSQLLWRFGYTENCGQGGY